MILSYKKFILESLETDLKYNSIIDFTCLKPNLSTDELKELCNNAIENRFHSVVVLPKYVAETYGLLDDNDIKIVTVINFPDGTAKSSDNIKNTVSAISDGANGIEIVIDYKELKEANMLENILNSKINKDDVDKTEIEEEKETIQSKYDKVEDKIKDVSDICHKNGVILKVIIEIGELNLEQIKKACEICSRNGADFIMTSTGTKNNSLEFDKVEYIRNNIPEYMKIKIAGGIRTLQDVEKYYKLIDRVGTSVILKNNNATNE